MTMRSGSLFTVDTILTHDMTYQGWNALETRRLCREELSYRIYISQGEAWQIPKLCFLPVAPLADCSAGTSCLLSIYYDEFT